LEERLVEVARPLLGGVAIGSSSVFSRATFLLLRCIKAMIKHPKKAPPTAPAELSPGNENK
jgi:hypothetical protein